MKKTGWLILGFSAVWFFFLRGASAIKFAFQKLTLVGVGSDYVNLRLDCLVKNPLWVGALVNNVVGTIYIYDIAVADVNYPLNRRIAANSITPISLTFTAYTEQLGEALYTNISTGDVQTLIVRFAGYIEVEDVKLNLDKSFTFDELFKNV